MDEKEIKEEEIETEDIIIEEVKEVINDPKVKEEWDNYNNAWKEKLTEQNVQTSDK